ncbi:chemotaxis protein CheD [Salinadaptatus halalkaliphilus]|uniref:chemotaxis protein CheD n=1 Tax=Salinadaptatus halalkaliphilus TaxID=2419781 RepID=UPI001FEC54D6|nr:chemotaxis protein CheD [Salinadaptatus halalkaliphilus]
MSESESSPIPVGVAEYALSTDEQPLRTSGVGSCVVVAIHDERAAVSGLLHFMLPTENENTTRAPPAKFADSGIDTLLEAFTAEGGHLSRTWSKLAGGAKMLEFDSFDRPIGDRNVDAARSLLEARGIPIRDADVGGTTGRMVTFLPGTGELVIKTASGDRRRY